MLKKNKSLLILTSAVTLLPILLGLLLWNKLPENMITHWGADGAADGQSGRAFAVFGMPLILLAVHWLCAFFTAKDPKNREQSQKIFGMVLWIIPVLSVFTAGVTYSTALGKTFRESDWSLAFLGLIFVIVGNYLPKTKQNHTIGIKIKWTLADEETWNATHRLAGKLWVVGGLLMMACVFLPVALFPWVLVAAIAFMAVIPVVHARWYYKQQAKAGKVPEKAYVPLPGWSRGVRTAVLIFTAALLVFVAVVCFTGEIEVEYGAESFTIRASYWQDATVRYDAIEDVIYREDFSIGIRTSGFGSPRLGIGTFENDELGVYTLYDYAGCDAVVVLKANGRYLVFGGRTEEQTAEFFERIQAQLN